jgi:hypothetical protein
MPLIHHVVSGKGHPAVVFVHGFGCPLICAGTGQALARLLSAQSKGSALTLRRSSRRLPCHAPC